MSIEWPTCNVCLEADWPGHEVWSDLHDVRWAVTTDDVAEARRAEALATLTRALTAQAWAVAIKACAHEYSDLDDDWEWGRGFDDGMDSTIRALASIPSPAQQAADILGAE